jgi:hypothetical protein
MLGVADTNLLGLARGTTWIVSWKNGRTINRHHAHARGHTVLGDEIAIKIYWIREVT